MTRSLCSWTPSLWPTGIYQPLCGSIAIDIPTSSQVIGFVEVVSVSKEKPFGISIFVIRSAREFSSFTTMYSVSIFSSKKES